MSRGTATAKERHELRRYVAPLVIAWTLLLVAGVVYFSLLGLLDQ